MAKKGRLSFDDLDPFQTSERAAIWDNLQQSSNSQRARLRALVHARPLERRCDGANSFRVLPWQRSGQLRFARSGATGHGTSVYSSASPESDLKARAILMAFLQELRRLGWTDDRNARFDIRYGESDPGRIRKYAAELVALAPDVILALGPNSVAALLDATAQFRLCLRLCPIRSAPALLIVSQNQAATRPAS